MPTRSTAVRSALLAGTLLVAGFLPTSLSAQADGTPIRIQTRAKPGKWITGRAQGITPDSIGMVLEKTFDTVRYARGDLHRMDVSMGRKSNAGRGAVKGAAIVGGVGLVLGVACVADTHEDDWFGCDGGDVAIFTAAGAVTGAALGALLGATAHHEQWRPAELTPTEPAGP
jgi:hypothetical protein